MNILQFSNSEFFGGELSLLAAPLVDELTLPAHVNRLTSSQEGYRAYWKALHGAVSDAFGFIDWDVLERHGMPAVEERRAASAAMLERIRNLCGDCWKAPRPEPSLCATFGVSLGMLYSAEEAAHAGKRIFSLASASAPELAEKLIPFHLRSEADFLPLRNKLVAWERDLKLTEVHREEAQFAARACVEFARRHFNLHRLNEKPRFPVKESRV